MFTVYFIFLSTVDFIDKNKKKIFPFPDYCIDSFTNTFKTFIENFVPDGLPGVGDTTVYNTGNGHVFLEQKIVEEGSRFKETDNKQINK